MHAGSVAFANTHSERFEKRIVPSESELKAKASRQSVFNAVRPAQQVGIISPFHNRFALEGACTLPSASISEEKT